MTEKIKQTLRDSVALRWFVLVLVSGLTFGTYWFQDFFSGLKPLMESQMGLSSSDFGALIGSTTIANICGMIIVGGIILDKWGIRITGIIFGAVATLGATIAALGSAGFFSADPSGKLTAMIVGRVLFGVGLEVVCVLVTRTIVKWFKGKEMALAMGINMGFGRLGSFFGTAFAPRLADNDVPTAVAFAATLIGIGFILFIVYIIFDIKIDKQLQEETAGDDEQFKFGDLLKLVTDKSFIFIALLCVAFYSAVFPFMQYAPDLLINKFKFTLVLPDLSNAGFFDWLKAWFTNAPFVAGLIPLGTILFTPVFGIWVDKKGKAASLMILGSLLLIFAHLTLSIFNSVGLGYFGLLALGIAFSLVPASMWPSVAKIVPESRLGTAYATMFTIQNMGLGLFFWGIGKVVDLTNPEVIEKIKTIKEGIKSAAPNLTNAQVSEKFQELKAAGSVPFYDYTIPIAMLVFLGVVSIFLAFMLKKANKEQGYGLEEPFGNK
ncbi:MAG: major facilitator superfamily domain-containing protein 1 [bacterium]|nr:major facilitator superfamily domain-containing protein 1 [bacterium]